MDAPLFAPLPPGAIEGQIIGVVLVVLLIGVFVKATANRKPRVGPRGEQNRRAGLGLLAICCGPLAGAALAAATIAVADVHPLDVSYTYHVFTIIGAFAGIITGIAFALTALFSPQSDGPDKLPSKSPGPFEEL